jgi:UDP-glucose 4-epimerase
MKIVVTGASGFVGRYLVKSLAAEHELFCIVRDSAAGPEGEGVTLIQGDLTSAESFEQLPSEADAIVHLAVSTGTDPRASVEMFEVNTGSTARLAAYGRMAGINRFIFTSSGNVYPSSPHPLVENMAGSADSLYGVTKKAAEDILMAHREFFDVSILRLFAPYGPGQTGRMIPAIVNRVKNGNVVTLNNGGQPRINPIYIDDAIGVIIQALNSDGNQLCNVAGPEIVSIKDIASFAGDALGIEPIWDEQTVPPAPDLVADIALMHRIFPTPGMVSPREGISRLVESLRGG